MDNQNKMKTEAELQKAKFLKDILEIIEAQQENSSIELHIVEKQDNSGRNCNKIMVENNTILFELDFKNDNILNGIDKEKKISIIFKNTIFKKAVYFKNINLEKLELKEVTFEKNVGIKDVKIDTLILRPYEIHGHIVVNVDGYANDDGIIVKNDKKSKNEEHFIKNIKFEDPHVSNAKIYFVGTEFENGDFTNRNLRDVIFQNCDFQNTYFLNSFLDKTTFLNCKFPTIRNDNNTMLLPKRVHRVVYVIVTLAFAILMANFSDNPYLGVFIFILMTPTLFYIGIDKLFLDPLNRLMKDPKDYLINHHIGIADERKLAEQYFDNKGKGERGDKLDNYDITLQNISAIYNDLKVNFKNVSNFQQSGDFYYAQNLTKTILSLRPYEVIILKLSFMINGFGERYVRSFAMIVLSLFAIGNLNNPNMDYVSTQATPTFLLDLNNTTKPDFKIANYDINNFLLISKSNFQDANKTLISAPAYDNRYDFKYNEQKIPKLNDYFWTRFYYATSHITAPFTQENKKWFKNMTEESYKVSFPITIFIWLCFIGMITAIFNRIRR